MSKSRIVIDKDKTPEKTDNTDMNDISNHDTSDIINKFSFDPPNDLNNQYDFGVLQSQLSVSSNSSILSNQSISSNTSQSSNTSKVSRRSAQGIEKRRKSDRERKRKEAEKRRASADPKVQRAFTQASNENVREWRKNFSNQQQEKERQREKRIENMLDDNYRSSRNKYKREWLKKYLEDPKNRAAYNENHRVWLEKYLEDPNNRDLHTQYQLTYKNIPENRELLNEYQKIYRAIRRTDPAYREKELEPDRNRHQKRREDEEVRSRERERNNRQHQIRRADLVKKEREQRRNTELKAMKRTLDFEDSIKNYEKEIKEGAIYICISCGGLFFKRTVREYSELWVKEKLKSQTVFRNSTKLSGKGMFSDDGREWLCITCRKHIEKGQLPHLALGNGLEFPEVHSSILALNDVEERLVSPRIPFISIRTVFDGQQKIRGNIVNVPIDTNETLEFLPREFNQSKTIQLKFMRRMDYNKPYMYDTIRPAKIVRALEHLIDKELFRKKDIKISINWREKSNWRKEAMENENREEAFIVNPEDNPIFTSERNEDEEDYFVANNQTFAGQETMYSNPNINVAKIVNPYDDGTIEEKVIAPGEGNPHLPYLQDKYNEELCFLKIYGGEKPCPYLHDKKFSYSAICRAEVRSYDRRVALCPRRLFYMVKNLLTKNLTAAIDVCVSKTKNTEGLKVSDALNKSKMNDLVGSSEANLMMRTIRSSPQFWQWKKMEINAMIKQLGVPTFFITFSPAERDWHELIIIVARTVNGEKLKIEDVEKLNLEQKRELLSKDPVSVARYFENRMTALFKLIFNKRTIFEENPMEDSFWRVDFQYTGSPHIHMLAWMKDAPIYEKVGDESEQERILEKCSNFIDKYITCERPVNDELKDDMYPEADKKSFSLKYQFHKHMANCKIYDDSGNF